MLQSPGHLATERPLLYNVSNERSRNERMGNFNSCNRALHDS